MVNLECLFVGLLSALLSSMLALAADAKLSAKSKKLFTNVNIFDGKNERFETGMSLLPVRKPNVN